MPQVIVVTAIAAYVNTALGEPAPEQERVTQLAAGPIALTSEVFLHVTSLLCYAAIP